MDRNYATSYSQSNYRGTSPNGGGFSASQMPIKNRIRDIDVSNSLHLYIKVTA